MRCVCLPGSRLQVRAFPSPTGVRAIESSYPVWYVHARPRRHGDCRRSVVLCLGKGWRASHSFGRGASGPTGHVHFVSAGGPHTQALESLILTHSVRCALWSAATVLRLAKFNLLRRGCLWGWYRFRKVARPPVSSSSFSSSTTTPFGLTVRARALGLHAGTGLVASAGRRRDGAAATPARGGSSRLGGRDDSAGG